MKRLYKIKTGEGFTLAEVLIVVAIIAVLVAIAIPIFTSQLEKSRQAADIANIRAAYAEAVANAITSSTGEGSSETTKMQHTGLFKLLGEAIIGDVDLASDQDAAVAVIKGYTAVVSVDRNGHVTLSVGTDWVSSLAGQTATSAELSTINVFYVHFSGPTVYYRGSSSDPISAEHSHTMTIGQPSDDVYWDSSATSTNYYYKWDGANWYVVQNAGEQWQLYTGN